MAENSESAEKRLKDFQEKIKKSQEDFEAKIRDILERIRQRQIEETKKRLQQ